MLANTTNGVSAFTAESFDFVVVGGGTAGLAVASRLSEDPNISVGVLEAGPDLSDDPNVASAGGWLVTAYSPSYAWGFETVPQLYAEQKKINLPRGRLLGGCSAMNAMMWTRASRPEYNALAELGNNGWDFESLLPYFKKAQSHSPQEQDIFPGTGVLTPHQGERGPIKTSFNTWYSSLIAPFIESLKALSFHINTDPNDGDLTGLSNIARAADGEKGTRQHSGVAYLQSTAPRKNLVVLTNAHATNIVLDREGAGSTARGVEFLVNNVKHTVTAKKEVILSAGAYGSPQLLELSGIGMPSILGKYGIETIVDLPVGENLQDHLMVSLNFLLTPECQANLKVIPISVDIEDVAGKDAKSTSTGGPFLFSPLRKVVPENNHARLIELLNEYLSSDDISLMERAQFNLQKKWLEDPYCTAAEAEVMFANLPGAAGLPLPDGSMSLWLPTAHLHPASRGYVHITSSDPLAKPEIDHKYLSRDYDLQALLQLVRFVQKIVKTGALGKIVTGSALPPPDVQTDEQLATWIRGNIATVFHPVGSTPMAPKAIGGVVDSTLKVYGTTNLRVVDAGILPLQLGATPMSTVYAIAEKAADMIKAGI
ncbi:hypothetical protein PLEOSDRAFT_162754 [Pleurotus ostreatus PC15]|uniref:Glucose-methanol-choline oxidoreductase N-terminal domain-containing protein n=1 Tax=Pleurotus ostreatus (strain PC15) TaxID=1137138 RepID=A0A067N5U2_PLEO1|nr:hypothetical protein PLEOSDRAFT_162754 [Pleurotus ostreatus PC15]